MNLLELPQEKREHFSKVVKTLVQKHQIDPNEIFMNVLESQEAPEMNYWMMKVLVQEHFMSPQKVVAQDQSGENVKALQAACLLGNSGVVAALLESNGFEGGVDGREYQLAARIASSQEDQGILGLLMKYAQEVGNLELFMRELQSAPMQ